MGLPGVGAGPGDVEPLAAGSGGGPPTARAAQPMAGLPAASGTLPALACLVERALMDEFPYRLYDRYLAVLSARMVASRGDLVGPGDSLFPD